jgi:hypothetical protein
VRAAQFPSPGIQKCYEACKAQADWKAQAIECGHLLMLDKPEELAGILESAA